MRILGADPGKTGALMLVDFDLKLGAHADMPVVGKRVDHHGLADVLELFGGIDHAIVEDVSASPQMGVSSAFSFGASSASLLQALASARIPFTLVKPNLWMKALGVVADRKPVGKPKIPGNYRARANQLMPWLSGHWPLKKHDGRIDASLLAYYGTKTT